MTNLIVSSSFLAGFYPSTLFLVFQVSDMGCKGNFSLKSQKLVFKDKKHKWPFFSIFTPNLTVSCIQTNHVHYKEIFPRLFPKFNEISTNIVLLGNFVLKSFAHSKKKFPLYLKMVKENVRLSRCGNILVMQTKSRLQYRTLVQQCLSFASRCSRRKEVACFITDTKTFCMSFRTYFLGAVLDRSNIFSSIKVLSVNLQHDQKLTKQVACVRMIQSK